MGTRRSSARAAPVSRLPRIRPARPAGLAETGGGAVEQRGYGERGQRGFFRGLPDHAVAADQRQRGIPGPDRDGEVEGADHAADAERVPGFHHAVVRALGGDGQAVELARQADREIADVDHLLHLAQAFGQDLAGFQGDQAAKLGLGGAQFFTQQAHQLATAGGGDLAPGQEGGMRDADDMADGACIGVGDAADLGAIDRRADRTGAAGEHCGIDAEAVQDGRGFFRGGTGADRVHAALPGLACAAVMAKIPWALPGSNPRSSVWSGFSSRVMNS
jgi:hypothetical protein